MEGGKTVNCLIKITSGGEKKAFHVKEMSNNLQEVHKQVPLSFAIYSLLPYLFCFHRVVIESLRQDGSQN